MAKYNFDLSEYQRPASADYKLQWKGCADLSPAFFPNSVACPPGEKALLLSVSPSHEFEAMFELYDQLDYPFPEEYDRPRDMEEVERRKDALRKIREKFGPVFAVQEWLSPNDASDQAINAFSGAEIRIPLGEGLLNFCYADFGAAFVRCESAYQELTRKDAPPKKIRRIEEGVIQLYELYAEIFPVLSEVFYSSIYTASFPPQFTRCTEKALAYYRNYLMQLKMPFGFDIDTIDIEQEIVLTSEQKAFAEEYGIPKYELKFRYKFPCFIHTSYACDNLRDMLYLEFTKILEAGVEFQKCRRCGRYFIVKGNYHGIYCDRVADGENRTCQQLAAQEAYLNKLRGIYRLAGREYAKPGEEKAGIKKSPGDWSNHPGCIFVYSGAGFE